MGLMSLKSISVRLAGAAVALLFFLPGCTRDSSPTSPNMEIEPQSVPVQIKALEKEHAFDVDGPGHPRILFADPTTPLPSFSDTSYDIFGLTFLWGQLLSSPMNAQSATDWSGKLGFNGEAIIAPLVPIDFESNQDTLFQTDNPDISAWASRTIAQDMDGLAFVIFIKRGNAYFQEPLLNFHTSSFSSDFHVAQLENYAAYFPILGKGAVAVFFHRLRLDECPNGTLKGEWIKSDMSGLTGAIQGAFYTNSSEPNGMFSGTFGALSSASTNAGSGGTLQGTISGYMNDQILGTFHGTWRYSDPRACPLCGSGKGEYMATYTLNDGSHGRMIGTFGYPASDTLLNLPLQGVWRTDCAHGEDATNTK